MTYGLESDLHSSGNHAKKLKTSSQDNQKNKPA